MTKMIAIKVDEETWRKWKELNKLDNLATKETKNFLNQLFEEYKWWFENREKLLNPRRRENTESEINIDAVSGEEILSEI